MDKIKKILVDGFKDVDLSMDVSPEDFDDDIMYPIKEKGNLDSFEEENVLYDILAYDLIENVQEKAVLDYSQAFAKSLNKKTN